MYIYIYIYPKEIICDLFGIYNVVEELLKVFMDQI